ncbi:hypothetical protein G7Y89_g11981 [Cudoniella acicularis]|uniref:SMP-30/Gluconolactonase/LRE-like region domain-containing protein n=1 Tax=Cudoniella acicularis TaxID=354080 RepID=A0A8H4R9T0_9HELO|nr:hypothetical protein G7Y89_g11981 [Cudoniella acicularis]
MGQQAAFGPAKGPSLPVPNVGVENRSPTPPPMEYDAGFQNNTRNGGQLDQPARSGDVAGNSYAQTSQFYSSQMATTISPNQALYSSASSGYHSPSLTTRSDMRAYQSEGAGNQSVATSSMNSDMLMEVYYPSDPITGLDVTDAGHNAVYYTGEQSQWLSGGDPDVFTDSTDYYYVEDPEPAKPAGDAVEPARILEVSFDSITTIYFRKNVPGSYICGYRQGIAFLDEKTGEVEVLKELIPKKDRDGFTMNDGGVDPQGRFWIVRETWLPRVRSLVEAHFPRIMVSRVGNCGVWRYDFDGATGRISNGKEIVKDLPDGVMNDGMVIDQNGNLWIAMWMMNCVMVYSPEGRPLQQIHYPAKCVTCPAWGGKDLDILFFTSAQPIVEKPAPGDEGGHLFRLSPGVKGVSKYAFDG